MAIIDLVKRNRPVHAFGQYGIRMPAAAAPATTPATTESIGPAGPIRLLRELAELKAAGLLSDEEVETKKQKILAS